VRWDELTQEQKNTVNLYDQTEKTLDELIRWWNRLPEVFQLQVLKEDE
jgi:hypothetical protein